ncbi:MAG: adenylate/guanylate cyclase domain-containing protein, partial [Arenicellales bacterium WSBS_2016_MAG_OTU3]
LFKAMSLTWTPEDGIDVTAHHHDASADVWERSPFYYLLKNNLDFLRRRLSGPEKLTDFVLLEELSKRAFTDYLAYTVVYDKESGIDAGDGIIGSWCTDRKSGFNDSDLRALNRIQRRLAVACKVQKTALVVRNILDAYLGRGAGSQVLKGNIKLGDMDAIHSVIWYSDLRDSTAMAEKLSGRDFLTVLNQYFDCTAGAIIENGGEVLRFVGDAVLAIFPINGTTNESDAAKSALTAVTVAKAKLAEINKMRAPDEALKFGLGLHIGDVLFGNIGVPERIEFSVIGPAAN